MKAFTWVLLGIVLLLSACAAEKPVVTTPPGELNPSLPTLFIAGDSTAAKATNPQQQGWGEPFADYFDLTRINIANRARAGRSSRTFITEGHWERLLAEVKAGDSVLIQFGHNDAGGINEEPPGSPYPLRAPDKIHTTLADLNAACVVAGLRHVPKHPFDRYLSKRGRAVEAI